MQRKKISLIIADDMEYKPVEEYAKSFPARTETERFGMQALKVEIEAPKAPVLLEAVRCGIGKENAAAGTAYAIASGADIILNFGLSGGISGTRIGDFVLGRAYVISDMDVTPFGYEKGMVPGEETLLPSDARLLELFRRVMPFAKEGTLATGDVFVNSREGKLRLLHDFGAMACDMESAAAALVCKKAGVPFLSIRKISDDAAEEATESYSEMNSRAEDDLFSYIRLGIGEIVRADWFHSTTLRKE